MDFWGKSSMGIALGKTKKASTAKISLGLGGNFSTGLQIVDAPSLEVFETTLGGALSNLV